MIQQAEKRLRLDPNNPSAAMTGAVEIYQARRADDGEVGKRIKEVPERLRRATPACPA